MYYENVYYFWRKGIKAHLHTHTHTHTHTQPIWELESSALLSFDIKSLMDVLIFFIISTNCSFPSIPYLGGKPSWWNTIILHPITEARNVGIVRNVGFQAITAFSIQSFTSACSL